MSGTQGAPATARRIMTFHGLGDQLRPLAPGEERFWIDTPNFHRILDVIAERQDVEVTFDDGNRSDLEIGARALAKRGLVGSFFVVADRIGRESFLSAADLNELLAMGMRIGSHGMRHVPWRGLPPDRLSEEIVTARDRIEQAVGQPVREAACPFGAYDRRSLRALRAAGFGRVLTSDGGCARADAWMQPRTSIRREDSPASVSHMLQTPPGLKSALRNVRGWLKQWR